MTGKGTYTLLVTLTSPRTLGVGALGDVELPRGGYAYTGSAWGSGGFARVGRHLAVAAGRNPTRRWHVDYLLGDPEARIARVVRSPGARVECRVADALGPGIHPGFGSSDCRCRSHLHHDPEPGELLRRVESAHREAAGRAPLITRHRPGETGTGIAGEA